LRYNKESSPEIWAFLIIEKVIHINIKSLIKNPLLSKEKKIKKKTY